MAEPLIIIFTLVNDRTRHYLQGLGLADCFHEDEDLAVITFAERRGLSQNPTELTADIVLLYDGRISRSAAGCLQQLCAARTVQVVQHRGNAEPSDRLRMQRQRARLVELCPHISLPFLHEHSTCGIIYDTLMLLTACIKRGDEENYRFCLQKLQEKSHPDRDLEQRLRLLHICLTPQGSLQILETEKIQPTLLKLSEADSAKAHALFQNLAKSADALSADYQKILQELRNLLLAEDAL